MDNVSNMWENGGGHFFSMSIFVQKFVSYSKYCIENIYIRQIYGWITSRCKIYVKGRRSACVNNSSKGWTNNPINEEMNEQSMNKEQNCDKRQTIHKGIFFRNEEARNQININAIICTKKEWANNNDNKYIKKKVQWWT